MKDIITTYSMPNLGCMIGTVYQMMLIRLSQILNQKGLDVTTGEYLVLRALYASDGMQQCEIATLIGKDKSAVCRTVTNMVMKGLVRTESVSHKCLKVYVAPKGREIEPLIMEAARERHKALTDLLTPEELKVFSTTLEKLIKNT
ncbi:MAG: MarR family transcriptional regulator [Paramuribaculum sp.]|nr:MarR family transcriptional regulator [Paramuribaculum sp.]